MSTGTEQQLVVVRVIDETNQTLTGRNGVQYTSPPQPREQALALVELLLDHPPAQNTGQWRSPIAGGRRTITLQPEGEGDDAQP